MSIDYLLDNEDMIEQKVSVRLDYDDLMRQETKYSIYEYKSKTTILGLPLVHIHYSRGMYQRWGMYRGGVGPIRKAKVARGIFAIGDIAIGVFALGYIALGGISLGIIGVSILGLDIIQFGLLSVGVLSIGYMAIGVIAIGIYAAGVLALGNIVAAGVGAFGKYAIGVQGTGSVIGTSIGDNANNICHLDTETITQTQQAFDSVWIPWPIKMFVDWIIRC